MTKIGRNGMSNPTFVLEKQKLKTNLLHFEYLKKETGIVWLYTLKAFYEKAGLALIAKHFEGFSIGNKNEHSKVSTYLTKHLHSYAPAYYPEEVESLASQSKTMSFNSLTQWHSYASNCAQNTSVGLRINPQLSLTQPSYCDSNISRLGVPYRLFLDAYKQNPSEFNTIEGLHFHALCHQNINALKMLISHIDTYYVTLLPQLKWLNLGGGQNFTDKDYDTEGFIKLIQQFKVKYPHLTLYFEPGSAVLHHAGYFECTILDIIESSTPIVILNTSIETHLLDVAITKHKPKVTHTSPTPDKTAYTYQLAGMSCIAGDTIGEYQFRTKLAIGDKIIFENMLGYTLVKQTIFNGLKEVGFKIVD